MTDKLGVAPAVMVEVVVLLLLVVTVTVWVDVTVAVMLTHKLVVVLLVVVAFSAGKELSTIVKAMPWPTPGCPLSGFLGNISTTSVK